MKRIRFLELENRDERLDLSRHRSIRGVIRNRRVARQRVNIVLRAAVKAEPRTRKDDDDDDDEEEEEAGETATAFHLSFLFFPPFLDRNRRRYAKVKDLPIREPVSISRENLRARRRTFESAAR